MIKRELQLPPDHIYPADEWRVVEKRFYPRILERTETIFTTANGYLGMRGNFEEGTPSFRAGTFVNGFYESWPIVYPEEAFGFAKTGQAIVNLTESKIIKLYVDDEPFFLPTATLLHFERALDMKSGTLDRDVVWETQSGKRVSIKSRRFVSLEHRHLAAISYEVTLLNAVAPIVISSELLCERAAHAANTDPRGARGFTGRILHPRTRHVNERRVILGHTTKNSRMTLSCGMDHALETDNRYSCEGKVSEDTGKIVFSIDARPGVPVRLTKYITYHTSRSAPLEELDERSHRTLGRAVASGFDRLLAGHRSHVDDFWRRSDVVVEGNPSIQQAIRFNLFQILQSVGRAEGVGLPAKGLTGQGYEGHYFWDAEIYVLPFLIYTSPRIARNLLKFRHSHLDKARQRAREVNQRGALFPWRTINGEEASAYYAAGTAQYHINADIVYALKKYVDATEDVEFLHGVGAEILVETARLWCDLGFFSPKKGDQFCIHGVTGPDEYNTVVSNNTYTNLMARENLWYAASTLRSIRDQNPARYTALAHDTGLDQSEIDDWQRAADKMYLPFDEKLGINPQDDSFLEKEAWDPPNTPGGCASLHSPLDGALHRGGRVPGGQPRAPTRPRDGEASPTEAGGAVARW